MFFIANVFTNVIVCQGLINAQKMKHNTTVTLSAPTTFTFLGGDMSNGLPPEIQPETEEKHEKSKSSSSQNAGIEDLHKYENIQILLNAIKQRYAKLLACSLTQYFEITLPPPEQLS